MRKKIIFLSKRLIPHEIRLRLIKFAQHVDSLVRYGRWNFVHSVAVEISEFCNRTCPYCPNLLHKTPKVFMEESVFEKVLERLKEIGWSGPIDYNFYNEPTADKRLPDLVRRTMEVLPKALPRVITNGDYLTDELMDKLIAAGVMNFAITRHPPFSAAWDAKITRLREKYSDYIKYGEIWKAPERLSNRGGAVSIEGFAPITSCMSPHYALNVMRNGDVVLCCADYHKTHPMGNLLKQSVMEIWDNPVYARLRKEVWNGTAKIDICRACFGKKAEQDAGACWHCGEVKPLGKIRLASKGDEKPVCHECALQLLGTAKYRGYEWSMSIQ